MSAPICRHGRQLTICAICAPEADARYRATRAAPQASAEQRLRDQLASEAYAQFTRADITAVLAELDAARALKPDPTTETRLREIAKLATDWDSYGALPIDQRAIDRARRVIAVMAHAPQIVPTTHSGVQLEWHRDGIEVEIVIADGGVIHSIYAEDA